MVVGHSEHTYVYAYVIFDNHTLCISYSALAAALLLFTYVCVYLLLHGYQPCICTYHIVQHVSEGASNDAVNGCDHLTSRASAGPTQSNVEVHAYFSMPIYIRI